MSANKDESSQESVGEKASVGESTVADTDLPSPDLKESNLTKESEPAIDSSDSLVNEQASSKANKELKSILALAKEAKLDTNIAHKRKSVNPNAKLAADGNSEELVEKKVFQGYDDGRARSRSVNSLHTELNSVSDDESNKSSKDKGNAQLKLGNRKRHSVSDVRLGGADSEQSKRIKKMNSVIIMNKQKDPFCWACHHESSNVFCETCPRSFHQKCLKHPAIKSRFLCPECITIMKAENLKQRSPAMQEMSLDHLCGLLKFALKRMMQVAGCEPFINPVSEAEFPEYKTYIAQPMDLTCLEKNIKDNVYGSTQAFESDAKWILHNSIIFNSSQSKLTTVAKNVMKICKQEMSEIENCASCYLNANTKRKTWFVEVCPKPHLLVWAKLKGFPYWPAKAMRTNSSGMVDVRFFGAHDRAWIPYKECFLFSGKDPNSNKQKRNDINESIKEVKVYIENLKKVYGEVHCAEYRTKFVPGSELKYLQQLLPKYKPADGAKTDSNSKSSSRRSSLNGTLSSDKLDTTSEKSEEPHSANESKSSLQEFGDEIEQSINENDTKQDIDEAENGSESNESLSVSSKNSKGSSDACNIECSNDTEINEDSCSGVTKAVEPTTDGDCLRKFIGFLPKKISRQNSDTSNSSLVSNSSDKINKVDISNNMEITLGSEDNVKISSNSSPSKDSEMTESKPKLVSQVSIGLGDNAEIPISPPSKPSVTDRLMKKLCSQLDENETRTKTLDSVVESPINKDNVQEETVIEQKISEKSVTVTLPSPVNVSQVIEPEQNTANVNDSGANTAKSDKVDDASTTLIFNEIVDGESKSDKLSDDPSSVTEDKSEAVLNENIECDKDETGSMDIDKEVTVISTNDTGNNISMTLKLTPKKILNEEMIIDNLMKNVEAESNLRAQAQLEDKGTSGKRKRSSEETNENMEIAMPVKKIQKASNNVTNSESNKEINNIMKTQSNSQPNNVTNSQTNIELEVPSISILQNRLSCETNKQLSSTDSTCDEVDPLSVNIKSEPVSEEEPSDDEYKELKRKYFSALDISEKLPEKQKAALKLPSRRPVDNLSKTINEVATNSCKQSSNSEITITRIAKQKIGTFSKPARKIQEIQRARKSFPSPSKPKNNYLPSNNKDTNLNSLYKKDLICYSSKKKDYTKVPKHIIALNKTLTPNTTPTSTITATVQKPDTQSNAVPNLTTRSLPVSNVTTQIFAKIQPVTSTTTIQLKPTEMLESRCEKGTESQNYIPQSSTILKNVNSNTNIAPAVNIDSLTSSSMPSLVPLASQMQSSQLQSNNSDDLQPLSSIIPAPLGKAISEAMLHAPPKLKPRPPGPLSTLFEGALPSNVGPITNKINSISHRLNDYLRGMLIELLHEVGTGIASPEAEIASLKLEIDQLKHKHAEEIVEIKKNISTILKDVQKSILQERNQLIEETRTACETECLKRVEEAKSKQWCAHCSKEAQFYCCWNTSYCDFQCQQAHWAKHMQKCIQNAEKVQSVQNINISNKAVSQQVLIKPSSAPKTLNKTLAPKTLNKVVLTKTTNNKAAYNFSTGSLTFVEAPSGSFELLGNSGPISVGGKFISSIGKLKSGSVLSVTSPTTITATKASGQKVITKSQKSSANVSTTNLSSNDVESD